MLALDPLAGFGWIMIRLTLALLATMFVTFMIAGADRGQVRYGLVADTRSPQTTVSATPIVAQAATVYVPSQPVIVASQTVETPLVAAPAPKVAALVVAERPVRFIAVASANVREGPSKDFAVVEKLTRGEAVTVLAASDDPDGWTLITIEGDGLEGYVSNALLTDQP